MDDRLRPGIKGERLPDGEEVFRLQKVSSKDASLTGKALPTHFELSTDDKKATPPSLSVWASDLTSPQQARVIRGVEAARLVLYLNVDQIRSLRPEPDSPDAPYLDVVWEPLFNRDNVNVPDERPGAEGHAAIINLKHPNMSSLDYRSLRSQLADLANQNHPLLLD